MTKLSIFALSEKLSIFALSEECTFEKNENATKEKIYLTRKFTRLLSAYFEKNASSLVCKT